MMKKTITAVLAATMVFGTCAFVQASEPQEGIVYAYDSQKIEEAKKIGIFEGDIDPDKNISRLEFCEYIYNMLNPVKELPMAKLAKAPFDDVQSYKVNALSFVGIVSGKGEGRFAPEQEITREEMATILLRTAEYAEAEIPLAKVNMEYADNSKISPWAVSAVYSLRLMKVLDDNGENFEPQNKVTFGEALSGMVNLYNIIK